MGTRLAAVRGEQEHTKASLGKATGLNPGTIGGIERGGQAGVATVETLAKALNVSPAWLAFAEGPRELPKRRRAAKSPAPAHP
jgi:transcriptional regulator with XRE-family HTH domain